MDGSGLERVERCSNTPVGGGATNAGPVGPSRRAARAYESSGETGRLTLCSSSTGVAGGGGGGGGLLIRRASSLWTTAPRIRPPGEPGTTRGEEGSSGRCVEPARTVEFECEDMVMREFG